MSSSHTEKKIASALNAAVQYNLDGLSPDEAVVKAAEDKGLNPEMTCRLVEGFNIASSRAYLRSATDKTASFPLADKEFVLKAAFYEAGISPDRKKEAPPAGDVDFWGGSGRVEMKVASHGGSDDQIPWATPVDPPKRAVEDLMEQVRAQKVAYLNESSTLRGSIIQAEHVVLRAVGDIANVFSRSANTSKFAEFEAEAVSEFGDDAIAVTDMAVKHAGLCDINTPRLDRKNFEKRAFAQLDWGDELEFVERALAARLVHKEASRKLADTTRMFNEQSKVLDSYVRKIAGLAPREVDAPTGAASMIGFHKSAGLTDEVSDKIPTSVPRAVEMASGTRAAIQKEYENAAVDQFKKKRSRGLSEPDEVELDNMKRQVILQDLLLNDEILSAQDPRRVSEAYNALLAINPSATLVPEVARSVLRNAVGATALDTFTAEQMSKLEEKMRSNQAASMALPTPSKPK